jgi:hypothetical protein
VLIRVRIDRSQPLAGTAATEEAEPVGFDMARPEGEGTAAESRATAA